MFHVLGIRTSDGEASSNSGTASELPVVSEMALHVHPTDYADFSTFIRHELDWNHV
jgi:hypothetical protein